MIASESILDVCEFLSLSLSHSLSLSCAVNTTIAEKNFAFQK